MDQRTIDLVKATVPVLKEHGVTITKTFYKNMFADHPELLNIFNATNQAVGRQPVALANMVIAAAAHIDDLEKVLQPVIEVAHKHRSLMVQPVHYPIVGHYLLGAIQEVLGEAATPEILQAWKIAYGEIANVFIQLEQSLYEQVEEAVHGWSGFAPFRCIRKERESEEVVSFTFERVDGKAVPPNQPGQYVSIRLPLPEDPYLANRQYTVSEQSDGSSYRISVKKQPQGKVSTYLHEQFNVGDQLEMTAPAGVFVYKDGQAPVTFLAAGIGITPMISMLQQLSKVHPAREHQVIHTVRNEAVQPFQQYLAVHAQKHPNCTLKYHYTAKNERLSTQWVHQTIPPHHEVYICGPTDFMHKMTANLLENGMQPSQIHLEYFGPAETVEGEAV